MDKIDCMVIGAGVVGLATARALAMAGREVMIVEAESAIGTHTSARNSEVIHAGISYAPGSLKGRFCVAGKLALYDYCEQRGIGHQRIGKLVIATQPGDLPHLDDYITRGEAHGVTDLRRLSVQQAQALEPELACAGALWSPSTGIVDSHALMLAYLGDAERHGAALALRSRVTSGQVVRAHSGDAGIALQVTGEDGAKTRVLCNTVVNAAGLGAQTVAQSIKGVDGVAVGQIPPLYFAIGHYFSLAGRSPFKHLVYPAGSGSALRAHVTLDLAGQCRFGPDLSWRDGVDYRFDGSREASFYESVRRYYPALKDGELQPAYTGIRPRLAGPDGSIDHADSDFVIADEAVHGVKGLVNLFGFESPGLTASLAIANDVVRRLAVL